MAILIDSNVLLRSIQPHHPHYVLVERALGVMRARNETLCITVQNCVEFWAVATRPIRDNGLGMTTEAASRELSVLKDLFSVLPESSSTLDTWEHLVTMHRVSGKNSHDARLVAVMRKMASNRF
jgi:predicted nucleic acid-binding protein